VDEMTTLEADEVYEMPASRVVPGDHVSVNGMYYRVWRVGDRGAALLRDAAWERVQRGTFPALREIIFARLSEMIVTGPTRRLRESMEWQTHTTCLGVADDAQRAAT
jgi:hypothetical protein